MPLPLRMINKLFMYAIASLGVSLCDAATALEPPPTQDIAPSEAAEATLSEAHDWLMTGAYDQAMAAYGVLAVEESTALEAGLGLARCKLRIGSYDEALSTLSALGAEESNEWHYLRAKLYRVTGEYSQVLAHASSCVRIKPGHAGARLMRGQVLEILGRRDDAIESYAWFAKQLVEQDTLPRDAEWITQVALGFLRYSVLTRTKVAPRTKHVLNEMLQPAYDRLDRMYWPARIAAADLLREKYNNDDSDGSMSDYRAALRINEHLPDAYVGMGEVALSRWSFEEIERFATAALDVNPNYAPALHLLAKKSLLERRYDKSIEYCDRALAINPHDIHALSISAGAGACQYDAELVRAMKERVGKINPRCALLHRTLGDALSGIRQYADSEREYKTAIEFDPTDANARTELGMMYMQWGEETKAREALEGAWSLDPFNERTKFTLELLEMLEKFDRVETEHFIVKYDSKADPGIGEFIANYLEGIYPELTEDYETPIEGKTTIEIFPTHRAFGVRITGKPWIHTVGAATGRVIALASPRDKTTFGAYNLARVLKHEFTHTVTLEATKNRIPHWFTEGLAVYQEDAPRSFDWCELLADAVRRDRLFTLDSIDWGFIRPRRASDRQMAYAQSEWMVEYIVDRFGYDIINTMLTRFRDSKTRDHVFREDLGIESEVFDREFRTWAKEQTRSWGYDVASPENVNGLRLLIAERGDDAGLRGRLSKAEFDNGELEEAVKAAQEALEVDENEPNALQVMANVLAMISSEAGDEHTRRAHDDRALPILERLLKAKPDGWTAPKNLADIALRRGAFDRAELMFKRLQRLCPFDPSSWRGLAGIYLDRGDDSLAMSQLLTLAQTEEHDPEIPAAIARIHERQNRLREAQYWYRAALYIDPGNAKLYRKLGEVSQRADDTRSALQAYTILTKLEPAEAEHFERAAMAATKLGDSTAAQSFARQALALDPKSSVRSLLP